MVLSPRQRTMILDLARSFVRAALSAPAPGAPIPDDPVLHQHAGCFVSLHESAGHALRGCVGRVDASRPLLEALRTASTQVLHDPRFVRDPVRLAELPLLSIEVSILAPPSPAATPLDFDPLADGIHLTIGARTGCFLPQVARETGWTREQLLDRLCAEKLGLPAAAWRGPAARLHRFAVTVIEPQPF